ncbi:hypothetical protein K1719_014843 [Acacia pycnantha]|nr:hypothetical protein K1719_014843 [Acacia pycnantha]
MNDSSMRTFTTARLEPPAPPNTKLQKDNMTVKIENSDGSKDVVTAGTATVGTIPTSTLVSGIMVKEDATKIFTDNLQTSRAYCAREENLKRAEEAGKLEFICLSNDGAEENMVWP